MSSFGLAEKMNSYPSQLSGGELKRVAIARSLINDPSVILADEPTGDLDVNTEKTIMEYIRRINREGKTIVMVTHNPALASYADRVYRVEDGVLSEVTDDTGSREQAGNTFSPGIQPSCWLLPAIVQEDGPFFLPQGSLSRDFSIFAASG